MRISTKDKFGLPANSVVCLGCGLIRLNPRPSDRILAEFYSGGGAFSGLYHRKLGFEHVEKALKEVLGNQFKMSESDKRELQDFAQSAEQIMAEAEEASNKLKTYGEELVDYLRPYIAPGSSVFEVGASRGELLIDFRDKLKCRVSGLEPKASSCEEAKREHDIDLVCGFSTDENLSISNQDVILNLRSINHMSDPVSEFRNAWKWLKPGGLLVVSCQESIEKSKYYGWSRATVEIDHLFMFSQRTLSACIAKAGFEILLAEVVGHYTLRKDIESRDAWECRILAKKTDHPEQIVVPDPIEELANLVRNLDHFSEKHAQK